MNLRILTPYFNKKSGIKIRILTHHDMIERIFKVADAQEGSVFSVTQCHGLTNIFFTVPSFCLMMFSPGLRLLRIMPLAE